MHYVVTGGTGFLARYIADRIHLNDPDADIQVSPPPADLDGLVVVDHVVHCGTDDDLGALIELTLRWGATLHLVSSIAVAGNFAGTFTEDDFDVGQNLPTPLAQNRFDAERRVRQTPGLRFRIYRPGVVVGDSRTGEIDTTGGLHHLFGLLAKLTALPWFAPVALPQVGRMNVVPVDYVADALVALMHADGHDGQTFHLTASESVSLRGFYRALAPAAGLPVRPVTMPDAIAGPVLGAQGRLKVWRNMAATQVGIPAGVLDTVGMTSEFTADHTREALRGTGIEAPAFGTYAPALWTFWAQHRSRDPLAGRHVVITGASSGIGRASAVAVAARGATVFALARNSAALDELIAEIRADGGQAHAFACDVTDADSVQHTVTEILDRFGHVDYLVNNAGRSIRRSIGASTDRFHDYERVMAVNYFGAVRMVLTLLPHWQQRRFGHVVNVSSAGVQASSPRYSAYVPTKAALDAFAEVVAAETLSDHVTFTTIHMPLVRTPMIAPSSRLNPVPAITAEHAAAMVVRALVDKPVRIDTPLGTLGDAGRYLLPKLSRRVLHQLYLGYPDSAAARGVAPSPAPVIDSRPRSRRRTRVPKSAKRVARLVPGIHW
ncbi:short chain dehydrogenase [Mycolicibacterium murale]|uniref:Short chain dehydrogenase n=1 Tax=Mycolicibacterium murale TaxID=182220 RepID=A0A7I9WV91_9MYCO|nr:SDR family oxidoreductase [Mycolicibacterium murale]MCV7181416.1 SDR family oxidoreductase [Mycolicibacterium murale]GFG61137.1 short chain dehydrogenase [Mycolicibacterium murale]